MKENVGTEDRIVRSLAGPALFGIGYTRLKGRNGKAAGLATMLFGALLIESAITKVCPLNAMLGINTQQKKGWLSRLSNSFQQVVFSSHRKNFWKSGVKRSGAGSQQKLKRYQTLARIYVSARITFIPPKTKQK